MLKDLLDAVHGGTKGSDLVLTDWLQEQGLSHGAAVDVVHAALIGSSKPGERPYVFYDTVEVFTAAHQRFEFFRDLADKTEAETNCVQPRRLRSDDRMHVRRITAELTGPQRGGYVWFRINRYDKLLCSLTELLSRGTLGLPLDIELTDRDDINLSVTINSGYWSAIPQPLRISLHGWLTEPIGR